MIYYKEEKKELIIPSGFQYDGCGGSDCEEAIEQAREEGYQEGYADGQEDCPECSGGTCNLETRNISLNNSFDGDETITPTQGYDGFDSVRIVDNGYGQVKYESGYTQGFNDGQGGTVVLQDKSVYQNTNLVTYYPDEGYDGMRTISVDATGVYSNGHNDGQNYARSLMTSSAFTENGTYTRAEGWSSVTVNVQCPECSGGSCVLTNQVYYLREDWGGNISLYPGVGKDGFSSVIIQDSGYGDAKYESGYTAGLADCSGGTSCNLVPGQFELYVGWSGNETINPPATADGFSSFTIVDNGYYSQAYDAGFEDGYQSGIMETDCSSAITESYNSGFSSGRTFGRREGYYQGEQSVIHSFLAGNDIGVNGGYYQYGTLVAYYYTPSGQPCVITGYNDDCNIRWDDVFQSMSVDGGPLQSPQLYYYFTAGWHQIRFTIKHRYLEYAFSHNFQPTQVEVNGNMVYPYMDALKAVSLPGPTEYGESGVTAFIGTFYMNNGIRILSSSICSSYIGDANIISGAPNLNIIISHYEGNDNVEITSDVQNGILFYPQGKASTHSSTLTGWTHMELF